MASPTTPPRPDDPIAPTTGLPRARFSGTRLAVIAAAHAALLAIGAIWVISTHPVPAKEELIFSTERPSPSADGRKGEHAVKLAKKKSSGGAPPNARRLTTTASKAISLPSIPASSISDFQPGLMGGGMGSGLAGLGTGSGLGGGTMGLGGRGGGRIKFFGFDSDASSVILAIDTSGSMIGAVGGAAGIAQLQSEIGRTIEALSLGSLFNIICFGQDADAAFPANVLATSDNKRAAQKFMAGYYGDGGFGRTRTEKLRELNQPLDVEVARIDDVPFTPLTVETVKGLEGTSGSSRMDLALVAAMQRGASTIFLLSDGQPSAVLDGKPLDQDDLIDVIRDHHKKLYKGKPLVINTIYTNTNRREEAFMRKIARQFGGQHRDVRFN